MPTLIALRSFRYGARHMRAGDVFEATAPLARLYVSVGRARPYVDGLPQIAVPVPAVLLAPEAGAEPKRPRRTYKRRDLRAED